MLPSINILLPAIFIAWCVGAYFAFGGGVMLFYPAMWGCVAVLFFILSKVLGGGDSESSES